jgi:hypothetical protein
MIPANNKGDSMPSIIVLLMSLTLLVLWATPSLAADESKPCTAEPTNMRIRYGDVIACDLSTGVDSDGFTFSGRDGDKIVLAVTNPGEHLILPCIELFAPSGGDPVASACGGFFAGIGGPFELEEPGIWRIIVSERELSRAGPYTLSLARVAPVATPASPIAFDVEPITDMLDPSADFDLFTFEGLKGAQVRIVIANPGEHLILPCIELLAPNGAVLSGACGGVNAVIDHLLPQTGTYRILVSEREVARAGPYTLSLVCRFPPRGEPDCRPPPCPRTCGGLAVTIRGNARDNVIMGTAGNDVIVGCGGNDTIHGLGGNDVICGGEGIDTLYGGAGHDRLFGEDNANHLFGGGGNDRLVGGSRRDILVGGVGNDTLQGNQGGDVLSGGAGTDRLQGGAGTDFLIGGAHADTLDGDAGPDVCEDDATDPIVRECEFTSR